GWKGLEPGFYARIFKAWFFFLGPVLTIVLPPLKRVVQDRRIRPLVIIGAVSFPVLSLSAFFHPHYAAPYTALIYAILLQGLRHVRRWRNRRGSVGLSLTRAIPLICLVMIGFRAAGGPPAVFGAFTWCVNLRPDSPRESLVAKLKAG